MSDEPKTSSESKTSPEPRTWGPFNGRQLTTIICVVAAVILLPVGAWAAVSFTNVAITDPGGVNRAKVDATGHLYVGDGTGPLSVDGSVTAALPAKPITIVAHVFDGPNTSVQTLYGPQSRRFGITSLTVRNADTVNDRAILVTSVTSTGSTFALLAPTIAAGQTMHFAFPSPLVLTPPAGGTVTLQVSAAAAVVSGVGVQS